MLFSFLDKLHWNPEITSTANGTILLVEHKLNRNVIEKKKKIF